MLTRRTLAVFVIAALTAAGCSSSDDREAVAPSPTAVGAAEAESRAVGPELRIGMVLNISAPSAERDEQVRSVFQSAIASSPEADTIGFESLQIDEVDDVGAAVEALRGLGVTVLVTTCDDSSVPAVVDTALASGLLVLTGCATLPRPVLDVNDPLFIDVGALSTAADALVLSLIHI